MEEEDSWENRYRCLIKRFRDLEVEQEILKEQLDEFGDERSIEVYLGEGFRAKQKRIRERLLEYGEIRYIDLYSREENGSCRSRRRSSCHPARPPGLYQLATPYRSVLDAMGHAVFVYNPISGEICFWNPAAEDLYGYKSFEAVGETFPHLIAGTQYYAIGKHIMAALRCGSTWSGQFPFTKRNGETFMALVNKTPLYDYGELIGVITVSSDGTAFNLSNNDADANSDTDADQPNLSPANPRQPSQSQGQNFKRVQWINPQSSRIASSVSNLASKVRIWNQGDDKNDEEILQDYQDVLKKPPTNTPVSKVRIWTQEDNNDVEEEALLGSKDPPKNEDDLVNSGNNESSSAFPRASKLVSKIQLWRQGDDKNSGEMVDCQRIASAKLPEMHTKKNRFAGFAFRVEKNMNDTESFEKCDASTYDQSSNFASKIFSKFRIGNVSAQQSRDSNQQSPTVPTSFRCVVDTSRNENLAPLVIHQTLHSQAHIRKSSESLEGPVVQVKDLQNEIPQLTQQLTKKEPDSTKICEIRWDDLQLKEEIGQGTFATVFRGIWNGSDVAVKIYFVHQYSEKVLSSHKKEIDIISKLRHPNVLLYMGAVYSPKRIAMATEYLPRGSLFKIIHHNPPMDLKRCLKIALDIAKGMNYLHHRNPPIIHGDLKSSNVLVDINWTVKVGDFGLSKMKESTFLTARSDIGTPHWMAPEVLRSEPSNEKSDVYSFGVILWEMMTRSIPWHGMNPSEIIGAVGFLDRRLDIPDSVSPPISAIIHDCWQRDMAARPSFEDIIQTLSKLISHQV